MRKEVPAAYQRYLSQREAGIGGGRSGVTVRAVCVGGLISLGIGLGLPYANMIIKGGLLGHNFNTPAAVFTFFVFVGGINVALGWARRTWELDPAELATVYIMALLATAIPTVGFSENLLPVIAGFTYYATPENKWEAFHPHLPSWLVPQDAETVRGFYEGLEPGAPVPWEAWLEPLFYWCILILAIYWVSVCTMVIMRRQWMEREKLLYPLIQVPLDMLRDDDSPSRFRPFFRSRIMWMGFALPFLLGSFNALHAYDPQIPAMVSYAGQGPLTARIVFMGAPLIIMFNFGLVGFAYLLSRDVALGVWFFFLVANFQRAVFQTLGIRSEETLSRFANHSGPYLSHQAMGAMIVLVFSGLWAGREHLRNVARKALGLDDTIDDSREVLSYRTAVVGLLAGLAVISVWLWQSGLPPWMVPVFLFAVFVVFTALTRAVVEGGVAVIRTPLTPSDFVISGFGTSAVGAAGVTALGLTYVWAANLRLFFMPCFANALKMAEEIGDNKRPLIWAVVIAVVVSLVASIWCVLQLSYQYGGVNLHGFWFIGVPRAAGNYVAYLTAHPSSVSWSGWLFTGIGAMIMAALTWVRACVLWWPVHPLGFAISTFYIMNYVWFSVFVAWAIKSGILRYGGPGLFRRLRPFFLGLIMGQISVTAFWLVVDHFTGVVGNTPIGGSFV